MSEPAVAGASVGDLIADGKLAIDDGRHADAVEALDEALRVAPGNAEARFHRGRAHRMLDQFDAAVTDLDAAIEALDELTAQAYAERGEAHRLAGSLDDAVADFDRAIELRPDDPWTLGSRAQALKALDHDEVAVIEDLSRAIELSEAEAGDPAFEGDAAWLYVERGETYRDLGRYADAIADLDRAIELDDRYALAYALRGDVHRLLDQPGRAIEDLTAALELDAGDAETLVHRADAYRALGRFADALADLDRAAGLDPDDPAACGARGNVHRDLRRLPEALADFTRAVELDPDEAEAWTSLGSVRKALGDHEGALAALGRAAALDPDGAWAAAERGDALRLLGRVDEAIAALDRAVRLDPGDAWARLHRARALLAAGRDDEAVDDLDQAVRLAPEDDWARYLRALAHLGRSETEAGRDLDRAVGLAEDALEQEPEGAAALTANMVVYHAAAGRYDEAWRLLQLLLLADEPVEGALVQLRTDLDDLAAVLPDAAAVRPLRERLDRTI